MNQATNPDLGQIANVLLNNSAKIQPIIDEFYLTPDGKKLQEGLESFKAYLAKNAHRIK